MQKIERYGVIALVFLLVTIVAVSFWGDSKSPGFWSRLTGRGAKKDAPTDQTASMIPPANSTERAIDGSLPLTPADAGPANAVGFMPAGNELQPTGYGPGSSTAVVQDPWARMASAPPEIANPGSVVAPAPMASGIAPAVDAPAPRTQPAPTGPRYTVQKGDSLIRIAARTLGSGSRWTEIQSLNAGLDPRGLRPGMKIVLPASARIQGSGATPSASPDRRATTGTKSVSTKGTGTYVVRAGDTLSAIASRMLGSRERWRELVAANPGLDPKHLLVGQSIRVPRATTDGSGADDARTASARTNTARAPVLASAEPRSDRPRVR